MEERWETRTPGRGADGSAVCKTPDAAAEAEKALPVPTEKDGTQEAAGSGEGADTLGQSAAAIIPEAYAPEREECPLCSGGEYINGRKTVSENFQGTLQSRINVDWTKDTIQYFPETEKKEVSVTYDFITQGTAS